MVSFAQAMPMMLRHAGIWDGVYRHVSFDFVLLDEHRMRTVYIQHNRLEWADGRVEERDFPGVFDGTQLRWDTDRFHGYGWETHGVVMLHLDRKDVVDAHFTEMIELSADGQRRARTWQWFEKGRPTRRTLCDEMRIG